MVLVFGLGSQGPLGRRCAIGPFLGGGALVHGLPLKVRARAFSPGSLSLSLSLSPFSLLSLPFSFSVLVSMLLGQAAGQTSDIDPPLPPRLCTYCP